MTPKLKPFVEYLVSDGCVSFFARPGIAIEVEDDDGYVVSACHLMDGIRNCTEIKLCLKEKYSNYSDETFDELIELLNQEMLIEDVSLERITSLNGYDKNRWSRSIEYFGAYCQLSENKFHRQEKLKNAKVTIMGVGGVGSSVLLNLAALGFQNVRIIDHDFIELSNLNRQILYNESDIGKSKVLAAKENILKFNSSMNVEAVSLKINSSSDIEKIIDDQDLLINAADHPREEIIDWVNLACVNKSKPFICGALDFKLAICYGVMPEFSGCVECWKLSAKR